MKIELAFNKEINGVQYCKGAVLELDDPTGVQFIAEGHIKRGNDTPARKNMDAYKGGCLPDAAALDAKSKAGKNAPTA